MTVSKEMLWKAAVCVASVAAFTTGLDACSQLAPNPVQNNSNLASPQSSEMAEIVITASRHPGPTG